MTLSSAERGSMQHTQQREDAADDATVIRESMRRPDEFAVIFGRHAAHIHRYLARRLGQQMADDLVGETFLIAFGKRAGYQFDRPDARPWLYGIATRLVGQQRRVEEREYRLRGSVAAEQAVPGHAERVVARVAAQDRHDELAVALADLTEGDRDVLLLVAWEGFAYAEVAEALAIPVGTVRSRLNRARRQVRAALSKEAVHG